MKSNIEAERNHAEKCREVLIPLGFIEVRPSVFAQRKHQWYTFDVSAIDPDPTVLVPYILDKVWDTAKAVGGSKSAEDHSRSHRNQVINMGMRTLLANIKKYFSDRARRKKRLAEMRKRDPFIYD